MSDTLFLTRQGSKDQYADGKAAQVWEVFIGDQNTRTDVYKNFVTGLLNKNNCKRILDVACGTGIDSVMLVEAGYAVTSIDASDKMLKYALKKRWQKRKEAGFDAWVIEEANWLTLADDIEEVLLGGFDAVICLGNSFAHLMDTTGDQSEIKKALQNFERCVKPGGLLIIDHRNFDYILDNGKTPSKCIYYNSLHTVDIKTSTLYVAGKPSIVTMDYCIDISQIQGKKKNTGINRNDICEFRLSYYPHKLSNFTRMLEEVFPPKSKHTIYGDFKQLNDIEDPGFYIHVIEKTL